MEVFAIFSIFLRVMKLIFRILFKVKLLYPVLVGLLFSYSIKYEMLLWNIFGKSTEKVSYFFIIVSLLPFLLSLFRILKGLFNKIVNLIRRGNSEL